MFNRTPMRSVSVNQYPRSFQSAGFCRSLRRKKFISAFDIFKGKANTITTITLQNTKDGNRKIAVLLSRKLTSRAFPLTKELFLQVVKGL
jgi:ribosomal protein S8